MPDYLFTGGYPRALFGLTEGVNAHLDGAAYGATIEPSPGDVVHTDEAFDHAELELIDEPAEPEDGPVAVEPEAVTLTADEVAHLAPDVLAAVEAAHTDMTAEGAPAPENKE